MSSCASPIRVLVVDDSAIARNVIAEILRKQTDIEIVGFCEHGGQVADAIDRCKPDVITLDVEMPKTDGPTLLRQMHSSTNATKFTTPVVMVSSLTSRSAEITLECLAQGAVDFVLKPTATNHLEALTFFSKQLPMKIRAAAYVNTSTRAKQPNAMHTMADTLLPKCSAGHVDLSVQKNSVIIVGASTGGPKAAAQLLESIRVSCPPVILAIHMPSPFTRFYAERLNKTCSVTVREAKHLEVLAANTVYVAPGNKMISLRAGRVIYLEEPKPTDFYKPSIDYLFESAAKAVGKSLIACVLTGMGRDGSAGAHFVRSFGGTVITQDEKTSIIYGMPKAICDAKLSQAQLSLTDMAATLFGNFGEKS
jgi:two-component system, chemotaxis family, protein-glutamate methylesterase/glutaminase